MPREGLIRQCSTMLEMYGVFQGILTHIWNLDDWNSLQIPCRPDYESFSCCHFNKCLGYEHVSV